MPDPRALRTPTRDPAPSPLLAMQATAGNRAVGRLIQTKLKVGAAHDQHEQQADRNAQAVASSQAGEAPVAANPVGAAPAPPDVEAGIARARGGGRSLPGGLRAEMEGALGGSFGDVRLHSGPGAAALNERLSARAFTTGRDVFLGAGSDLSSSAGRQLVAHELTHVQQQSAGTDAPIQRDHHTKADQRRNKKKREEEKKANKPTKKRDAEAIRQRMAGKHHPKTGRKGTPKKRLDKWKQKNIEDIERRLQKKDDDNDEGGAGSPPLIPVSNN